MVHRSTYMVINPKDGFEQCLDKRELEGLLLIQIDA